MSGIDYSSEEWKSVVGFEGLYSVSNMGRVRRDAGGKSTTVGRILKGFSDEYGYRKVHLHINGIDYGKSRIHRLVMESFIGQCPIGYEVNHVDGDKTNNRLENLEYVTPSQNMRHRFDVLKKGNPKGENNGSSKLTDDKVREIRQYHTSKTFTIMELAERYNVTTVTIYYIVTKHTWKHVE